MPRGIGDAAFVAQLVALGRPVELGFARQLNDDDDDDDFDDVALEHRGQDDENDDENDENDRNQGQDQEEGSQDDGGEDNYGLRDEEEVGEGDDDDDDSRSPTHEPPLLPASSPPSPSPRTDGSLSRSHSDDGGDGDVGRRRGGELTTYAIGAEAVESSVTRRRSAANAELDTDREEEKDDDGDYEKEEEVRTWESEADDRSEMGEGASDDSMVDSSDDDDGFRGTCAGNH